MSNNEKYYVYAYFDPMIEYYCTLCEQEFNVKPVYIGKGRGKRYLKHLHNNKKTKLTNLNKFLITNNIVPCYSILEYFNNEADAFKREIELIATVGRENIDTGPLYNLTNGGEGSAGIVLTNEQKENRSKSMLIFWNSLDKMKREKIGQKSLANRHPDNVARGIKSTLDTKHKWSTYYKQQVENERYNSWKQSYCNTDIKRQQRSLKCKIASSKREMYFITFILVSTGEARTSFLKDMINEGYGKDALEWRIKGKTDIALPYKVKHLNDYIIIQKVEKKIYSKHSS
jgi:hypothetical protein